VFERTRRGGLRMSKEHEKDAKRTFEWQLENLRSHTLDVLIFRGSHLLPEVFDHRDEEIQGIFEYMDFGIDFDVEFTEPVRELELRYS
jgi:hypothetical protein